MNKAIKKYTIFALLLLCTLGLQAQKSKKQQQRELFYSVLDNMYNGQYDQALRTLNHLDSISLEPFLKRVEKRYYTNNKDTVPLEKIYVKYLMAACYFEVESKSQKPLEYIEFVMNSGYSDTPEIVYKDLGDLYHRDYQFSKALFYYDRFLDATGPADFYYPYVRRKRQIASDAIDIVQDTVYTPIYRMNTQVNTKASEELPYISSDNKTLLFSRTHYTPTLTQKPVIDNYEIMVSHKEFAIWKKPQPIKYRLPRGFDYCRLAGVSPDAKRVYLAVAKSEDHPTSLMQGHLQGARLNQLQWLDGLNTEYQEQGFTVTGQGDTAYFASNRQSARGGLDIFMAVKQGNGKWKSTGPVKDINTQFDEFSPYHHPEEPILYFSSDGHKTMGETDIFYTKKIHGEWSVPSNIGFPINTVLKNQGISINPVAAKAYFSLVRGQDHFNQDIYYTSLAEGLSYTLLKGLLIKKKGSAPVVAQIEIINTDETDETPIIAKQPDKNGNYFFVFPPGNEYKMLIEAQGYEPRMIKFRVPEQKDFYELHQIIEFEPINLLGERVGERVQVENYFSPTQTQDTTQDYLKQYNPEDQRFTSIVEEVLRYQREVKETEEKERKKKYNDLIDFVDQAIEEEDTTSLKLLKEKASPPEKSESKLFDPEKEEKGHEYVDFNGRRVRVGEMIDMQQQDLNATEISVDSLVQSHQLPDKPLAPQPDSIYQELPEKTVRIKTVQVFFPDNEAAIQASAKEKLTQLTGFLRDHPVVLLEIHGYANHLGPKNPNYELSRERANKVKAFLEAQGIATARMQLVYHGEIGGTGYEEIRKNRRAEIILYKNERK